MNNANRDNFERIVQLAEFGAKRHDERRQVDFRVFIAYMTLLALAFSQIDKIRGLDLPVGIIWVGSGLIHLFVATSDSPFSKIVFYHNLGLESGPNFR